MLPSGSAVDRRRATGVTVEGVISWGTSPRSSAPDLRSFPAVLEAARAGEQAAFTAIYEGHAPLVLGYLRANGSRDPEDLAQDVFVAVVRSLGSFVGDERAFRSWILTIAHRRLVDEFRRRGRRQTTAIDEIDLRDWAPSPSPEDVSLTRMQAGGVLSAIDRLTPDQRSVLLLRLLADLTVPEIADIVGKPESAVKALLRRGQAALLRGLDADRMIVLDGGTASPSAPAAQERRHA
jgi:RNA polymerase sigma-70 factor (ECF subfamily)